MNRARYSSLVLLLGAGGVIVYLLKRRDRGKEQDGGQDRVSLKSSSLVKWLFEDEQ